MLFGASWVSLLGAWGGGMTVSLWVCGAALGGVAALNGIPGVAAVLDPWVRTRLLSIAEAAALASLTLSGLVGIGSFAAVFLLLGEKAYVIGAGIIIGIVSFPLSFGLVFPLGIPLASQRHSCGRWSSCSRVHFADGCSSCWPRFPRPDGGAWC